MCTRTRTHIHTTTHTSHLQHTCGGVGGGGAGQPLFYALATGFKHVHTEGAAREVVGVWRHLEGRPACVCSHNGMCVFVCVHAHVPVRGCISCSLSH